MKKSYCLLISALFCSSLSFAQIPTNGLVAYFPFTGNANDASVYAHNGTVYNATLTTDRFGNPNSAYYFNGVNAYIDLGIDTAVNAILGDFSLSYWTKTGVGGCVLASYSNQGSSDWRIISMVDSSGLPPFDGVVSTGFWTGSSWQQPFAPVNTIDSSQWYNVVYVRKGDTARIYSNGNLAYTSLVSSSNISNPTSPPATTKIGWSFPNNPSPEYFNGKLDEILIYNRALNAQEVIQVYGGTICSQTVYDTVQIYDTVTTHNTITSYDTVVVRDTLHTVMIDTIYQSISISVTDTLVINANLTGVLPPNNTNVLKVYPNPAHNYLEINTGNYSLMSGYNLSIVNALSQTVFSSAINQQLFNINLTSWSGAGTYILYITDPQSHIVATKEIVLQ